MTFLGLEIGGTKLQIIVGDQSSKILERRRLLVERRRGGAGIREQIKETLSQLIPAAQPAAVGVGLDRKSVV